MKHPPEIERARRLRRTQSVAEKLLCGGWTLSPSPNPSPAPLARGEGNYHSQPRAPLGHWYFLGSGLSLYLTWNLWTLAGLLFGAAVPDLQSLGLDFALAATFIAIVVPQLASLPRLAAAAAAGALAYLWRDLP